MTGIIIGIATVATLLGFVLGVRSKAVAKTKARDKERKMVEDSTPKGLGIATIRPPENPSNFPGHKSPPPPPPSRVIKEGKSLRAPKKKETSYEHMKPGIYYKRDTFVETSICKSCKVIAHRMDMATYRPCPKCGGKVKNHNVSKWDNTNKEWIETTAQ